MIRHLILSLSLFIVIVNINKVNAQDEAFVKKNKIKSITIYEQKADKGNIEWIENLTVYDKNGNIIEEKDMNSEGKVKSHYKYEYDNLSRKIKEISLGDGEKIIETHEYKYSGDLKTERITYSAKGKVIGKKRYVYTKYE